MPFSPLRRDGRRRRLPAKNGVMFHTATTATVDYDNEEEDEEEDEDEEEEEEDNSYRMTSEDERQRDSVVERSLSSFETFCHATSLHGWKYLSAPVNNILRVGWLTVVLASMGVALWFLVYSFRDFVTSTVQTTQDTSRASLDKVFFPSVTLCNINQGRRSFFLENGLNHDSEMLRAVLGQAYYGLKENLTEPQLTRLKALFTTDEVLRKGVYTDKMYSSVTRRAEAKTLAEAEEWQEYKNDDYVNAAGWYFKTLAAQEAGESNVLMALYGHQDKDTEVFTDFLPFFGTDYGLCSLIKPQISFNKSLFDLPFETVMKDYSNTIEPGIMLGKENGLTLMLDAEVYDYAFSPQRGEGFKVAIHSPMDQPIMALTDIDLSPGFVTQLSVTPILRDTTHEARWRFNPVERGCYFDGELEFKYLPKTLYRYGLSNCLFAATYDKILEECRCVPYFHTMAYEHYPVICSGVELTCMNAILRDIGSHTHVRVEEGGRNVTKPCLFACKDQSYTTAVTTSTFPNMHTFLRGPEFCLMVRKLKSSCRTSKNVTLEEQYPRMCSLIGKFPKLCLTSKPPLDEDEDYKYFFNGSLSITSGESAQSTAEQDADRDNPRGNVKSADDILSVIKSPSLERKAPLRTQAARLMLLLHKYARENLLVANIYIKDPAVTLIKRDQKIPVIWFVANIGGIMGLCMGCSLVTIFEVGHHVLLIFLKTGKKSVSRIQKTIKLTNERTGDMIMRTASRGSRQSRSAQGQEQHSDMEIRTEATADGDVTIIPNGRNRRATSGGLSVTFLAAAVAKTVTSSTNQLNECEAQFESLIQQHHQQQPQQQQQEYPQPQRHHAEQQTQTVNVKKCQTMVQYKNGRDGGGCGRNDSNGGGTVKKRARFRLRRTSL